MSMVGLVLLIALSNVVMLLMARNATRQREFSVRLALGAGRKALFRQLLSESLLLVSVGALLAWLFADSATRALGAWAQIESSLAPDNTALLFTLSILALAALLFGLVPLRHCALGRPGAGAENISGGLAYGRRQIARQQNYCCPADDTVCCAAGGWRVVGAHLA